MAKHLKAFIEGKTFEEIRDTLSAEPYNLKVMEKGNLYLLKYNMIDSPMGNKIVQDCRGIILEKGTNKVVACPFNKFFNYGEGHAAELDWPTTKFVEKIDGSLIKVYWYDNKWNVATNGTIDAHDAQVENILGTTFYDLWKECSGKYFGMEYFDRHGQNDKNWTYMFELVHPLSKIVSLYEPNIYFLGRRNNHTYLEDTFFSYKDVPRPKLYSFNSMDEALGVVRELPFDEEGYVAFDKDFNRQKIKSPAYVAVSHMKDGLNSEKNMLAVCLKGEIDEVLALFPEYTERLEIINRRLTAFKQQLEKDWDSLKDQEFPNRKEFALRAVKTVLPGVMFALYDKKADSLHEALNNISLANLVVHLRNLEKKNESTCTG